MSNEEADKMFNEWFKETYRITFNSYQQTAREAFMAAWELQQAKIDELARQNHPIMCMASDTGAITFLDQQSRITRLEDLLREASRILSCEDTFTDEIKLVEKIDKEIGK